MKQSPHEAALGKKRPSLSLMPTLAITSYVAFVLCGWAGYLDYCDPAYVWPSPLAVNLFSRFIVPAVCLCALLAMKPERHYRMFGFLFVASFLATGGSFVVLALAMVGLPSSYLWLVSKGLANASVALLCYCYYAYQASDDRNLQIAQSFVLGIALFFAVGVLPGEAARALTTAALPVVACGLLASFVRDTLSRESIEARSATAAGAPAQNRPDGPTTGLRGRRVRFYLSRVAWGALSGTSIALMIASPRAFDALPSPAILLGCSALLIALVAAVRLNPTRWHRWESSGAVQLSVAAVLPFMVTGFLLVPYVLMGSGTVPKVFFFGASLAWMLQAFFRLSEWTCLLGLSAPFLVASEDLVMRASRYALEGVVRKVLGSDGPLTQFVSQNLLGLEFAVGFGSVVAATVCIASFMAHWSGFDRVHSSQEVVSNAAQRYGLTPREAEVLGFLLDGLSRSQMCERLGISINTVNTHVRRIYDKTDAHGRHELADMLSKQEDPAA